MIAPMTDSVERRTATSFRPVWREVSADLETPVSAYLKLARGPYGYLLESVEGGERVARYSFVGADPYATLRARDGVAEFRWLSGPRAGETETLPCADPLTIVRTELERRPITPLAGAAPRFHGGAVGYLAYEAAARFEPAASIPEDDPLGLPEAVFMFSDTLLIFDHVRHTALLLTWADSEATDGDEVRAEAEAYTRLDAMEQRLRRPAPRQAPAPRRAPGPRRAVAPSRLESRAAYA
ncbi:MAG: anthranilate synthase component I, partial [Chloroflexota bacterium]|nr:anthranilate synthase component I [Chloroflexota bacterium]